MDFLLIRTDCYRNVRQLILNNLEKLKKVEEFLCFTKYLVLDDKEIIFDEEELYTCLLQNKRLAQVSLNVLRNYDYYENCQITDYSAVTENLEIDANTTVDCVTQYLLSYIALEQVTEQKNGCDVRSLMKSVCFYCDSALHSGRCSMCDTNSMDMRKYAQIHFRTLRREKYKNRFAGSLKEEVITVNEENDIEKEYDTSEISSGDWTTEEEILSTEIITEPHSNQSLSYDWTKSTHDLTIHSSDDRVSCNLEDDSTWICDFCTFCNSSTSTNCAICFNHYAQMGAKNEGSQILNKEIVQSEQEAGNGDRKKIINNSNNTLSEKGGKHKWVCWNPNCNTENRKNDIFCVKCGFQRIISRTFVKLLKSRQMINLWICDICSQVNKMERSSCTRCNISSKFGSTRFWCHHANKLWKCDICPQISSL